MSDIIRVEKLSKIYRQGELTYKAVNEVDLTIQSGELVILSGSSGSGKTTLLNMIGTLDSVSSGNIYLDGEDITKMSLNQLADFRLHNLGFIFQSYNLFPVFTAVENVEMQLRLQGMSKKEMRDKAIHLLNDVGLADHLYKKPRELSGGQQQRVAVARALVSNPRVIIGDEPTANLDSENSLLLIELLKKLKNTYNTTLILASHDKEVIDQAERSIVLYDGKIQTA